MILGRGEREEDVVDRVRDSGTNDPLTIELMQEVVYLRQEMAKLIRQVNRQVLAASNHRVRND
jgi:Fe2+ transport system protein FeoA